MAQINVQNIERLEKQRNIIHKEARATYTIFEVDGEKYVQLDTYGQEDRESPEKISQSIQLNRETARYLVRLLIDAYDLI